MFKVLITTILFLILTTSIYSQAEAKGGGFRGGSFGGGFGGKSFSSNSIPMGTGQGKMFTTSPSGKINPQDTAQQGSKQTASSTSSASSSSSSNNNPQNNFKSQSSSQSQFQQQPRSNFFGGGLGGFGGFGNMIMASIMGNFIGQALFGWMLPHPTPVAAPAPTQPSSVVAANNGTSNNQA